MHERRPTPEDMLARAAEEAARTSGGRLKIFFGASPGVGKTYAMLEAAHAAKRQGRDVVVGWVETHKRPETEALVQGLEQIPAREVAHRGMALREMDVDAVLARQPALVLIDELAHENAPGSRHARRWQDVLDVLAAGIDVWTTLNVQHVESQRDVVAGITGIVVRQTVPDELLARADSIELVDLSPDDLLKRLQEGKVYLPEQAERAVEHFFTKGNLIALRELALRRTAERVDVEGARWRREHGVTSPWGARARVLVAVGPAPQSADVVRSAARLAEGLKAPWIVLSVETPATSALSAEDRARVAAHMALAERMGAEPLVVRGERVGEEILAAARARDVTHVVVGKPTPRGFLARLRPSLVDWLVRGSGGIEVHVTSGAAPATAPAAKRVDSPARNGGLTPQGVLRALLAVGLATLLGWALEPWLGTSDQAMLMLVAILVVAARGDRADAWVATLLGVACLNFFFVPPRMTFAVDDTSHLVTFVVLLAAGLVGSAVATRIRRQAALSEERERATAALYDLSRDLAAAPDAAGIARGAVDRIGTFLGTGAALWVRAPDGSARLLAEGPGAFGRDAREAAVAQWVLDLAQPAGRGTDTLPGVRGLHLPLPSPGGLRGVLAVDLSARPTGLDPSVRQLLETMSALLGSAFERAARGEEARRASVAAETERTRSMLLAAVSHDLRTPLAGIRGSAEVLLGSAGRLEAGTRRDLLASIRDESERLGTIVSDLLELTRIQAGSLVPARETTSLEDLARSALDRARPALAGREVRLDAVQPERTVEVDPVLVEQVVWNLLMNAAQHTPAGSPVDVRVDTSGPRAMVDVLDRGPGLAPGERTSLDRFQPERGAPDAPGRGGLGLTLASAIAGLHQGELLALARPGGGAILRLTLPYAPAAEPERGA